MVLSHPTEDVENNKGPWAALWGGDRSDGSNLPQGTTPGWPHFFSVSSSLVSFALMENLWNQDTGWRNPMTSLPGGQYPTVAITSWMLEGRTWYRDPAPISEIIFRMDLVILCLNTLKGFKISKNDPEGKMYKEAILFVRSLTFHRICDHLRIGKNPKHLFYVNFCFLLLLWSTCVWREF